MPLNKKTLHVDALVFEIGSTTTLVNAFDGLLGDSPRFVAQGSAATTVTEGDVTVGLEAAKRDMLQKSGFDDVACQHILATSSAAGGLRMSVHGLVRDMTVKAAEFAALGAGAVLRQITAGHMSEADLDELKALRPNLILISGGTDYGERETALSNARKIAALDLTDIPVLYAGNVANQGTIRAVFDEVGQPVTVTDNVYPRLDELVIQPCRSAIQALFEAHIVRAPGMERIRQMVNGPILPTPGAVMAMAQTLAEDMGPLVTLDIGGATTDVHSVCETREDIAQISHSPEPVAKRTVEGDLGLFVNARHVFDRLDKDKLARKLGFDPTSVMDSLKPLPDNEQEEALLAALALEAGETALRRHAGRLRPLYLPEGRRFVAEGKDLGAVTTLVATGGALTRLSARDAVLRALCDINTNGLMLYPKPGALTVKTDNHYIMASLGALSRLFPDAARLIMKNSFEEKDKT